MIDRIRKIVEIIDTRGGYRLKVRFDTEEVREIDLTEMLERKSGGKLFRQLSDMNYFKQVKLNDDGFGCLEWPNGLDLCPDALYLKSTPIPVVEKNLESKS